MMSYMYMLTLHVRIGVYVIVVGYFLQTTECLENRRLDRRSFASSTKEVNMYAPGEKCTLEADKNTEQRIDPFDMLPSNNMKNRKTRMNGHGKRETGDNTEQWIDPFEMLPSNSMQMKLDASVKREKQCEVYMQRFINLFLRRSGLTNYKLQHGSEKQVNFDFIIRSEDLAILQKYGESGKSEDIFAVNDVLTNILGSAERTVFSQKPSSFEDSINIQFFQGISSLPSKVFSSMVDSPETSIPICIIAVSLVAFYLVYVTRSYKVAALTIMYTVFAANFGITWYRMYQEEMSVRFYAEMKYSGAPSHCKGEQLSWFQHLYSSLFGEDCDKYYKKHFTSPMSQVSLNAVFSESVSVLVLYPAQHIAKAYGDFISTATGSVPFFLKPFVFPVVCFIPILVLFILLALLLNYQISISPFTGFRIIPHWGQSRCCKGQEENEHIEKPSDTVKSSKIQPLESTIASNESHPLVLLNGPAAEKYLQICQKGKDEAATKKHNNKVCNNCQIVMSVPSNGGGDSPQNVPITGIKKNTASCNQEICVFKQLKESEAEIKQHVMCSGDCCIQEKTNTVLSEDLNSICEKAREEGEKSGQQLENTENKDVGISSCQCQKNKESGSVLEKLKG